MNKETSSRVSTIAAEVLSYEHSTDITVGAGTYNALLEKAKTLAGSCMSQDETAGQVPAHEPNFIERMQIERNELEGRLNKLAAMLAGDKPHNITSKHWELLKQQLIPMSEYLVTLDARIADLKPVPTPDDGFPPSNEDDR